MCRSLLSGSKTAIDVKMQRTESKENVNVLAANFQESLVHQVSDSKVNGLVNRFTDASVVKLLGVFV